MARAQGSDRGRGGGLRVAVLVVGFGLAGAATVAVLETRDPQLLRLAVVGALWAFLLAALAVPRRRDTDRVPADLPPGREVELRRTYEIELEREVAARREYELQLEVYLRRELDQSVRQDVEALREEVQRLRAEVLDRLDGELRMERIETTRLIGGSLRALQDEARRLGISQQLVAEGAGGSPEERGWAGREPDAWAELAAGTEPDQAGGVPRYGSPQRPAESISVELGRYEPIPPVAGNEPAAPAWPTHEPPTHEPPTHEPPTHEPPTHEPPTHEPPTHEPPTHEPPTHEPPGYQPPGYQPPGYQPAGYERPGNEPPEYGPAGYQRPGDERPGRQPPGIEPRSYQPPEYRPPGYGLPGYGLPGYGLPGHQPPGDEPPGYGPAGGEPAGYGPAGYEPAPAGQQPATEPAYRPPEPPQAVPYGGDESVPPPAWGPGLDTSAAEPVGRVGPPVPRGLERPPSHGAPEAAAGLSGRQPAPEPAPQSPRDGLPAHRADDELSRIFAGTVEPSAQRAEPGESTGPRRRRRREDDEQNDVLTRLLGRH
jgi:hypothetical protein